MASQLQHSTSGCQWGTALFPCPGAGKWGSTRETPYSSHKRGRECRFRAEQSPAAVTEPGCCHRGPDVFPEHSAATAWEGAGSKWYLILNGLGSVALALLPRNAGLLPGCPLCCCTDNTVIVTPNYVRVRGAPAPCLPMRRTKL